MKQRFIAAVLLLNVVSWANSAAYCLSGMGRMASQITGVLKSGHATSPQTHACCPHLPSKPESRDSAVPASEGIDHRCCFVQNPQIPSNLPAKSRSSNPYGQSLAGSNEVSIPVLATIDSEVLPAAVFRNCSTLSTVLRI